MENNRKENQKAKNSLQGKMERGEERVKKGIDNAKHDAAIGASKAKETIKNKAEDIKDKFRNNKK
ncbi:MAG: hypothetical protein E6767_12125 [Dysgonomonas sp.]|nr:hypothetical protein [Dysgonomonas sp.]